MKVNNCRICSIVPNYKNNSLNTSDYFDNSIELAIGGYEGVYAMKDNNGKVAIYGWGDDYTELYFPKYCPECGRKFHE